MTTWQRYYVLMEAKDITDDKYGELFDCLAEMEESTNHVRDLDGGANDDRYSINMDIDTDAITEPLTYARTFVDSARTELDLPKMIVGVTASIEAMIAWLTKGEI